MGSSWGMGPQKWKPMGSLKLLRTSADTHTSYLETSMQFFFGYDLFLLGIIICYPKRNYIGVVEPREGEPRQLHEAGYGLLGATGPS